MTCTVVPEHMSHKAVYHVIMHNFLIITVFVSQIDQEVVLLMDYSKLNTVGPRLSRLISSRL